MTDQDWGDLDALPSRKSGAPRWLWACGGGCLLMFLVFIAAGWGLVSWYKDGLQGEDRWTRLAEILPHDERSEAYAMDFGQTLPIWDVEFFLFTSTGLGDSDGLADAEDGEPEDSEEQSSSETDARRPRAKSMFVVLMYMSGEDGEGAMPELVDPESEGRFSMEIQGRELTALRLDEQELSESWAPALGPQPSLAVELTVPGEEGRLLLLAGRQHSTEPVTRAEIAKFLAPFHVGPER